jgi:cytochrome d ubiquinol oxidase subunit I
MVFSVFFPHIALQAGWVSTEMGRQPWSVWKIFRTSEGVSTVISAGQVKGSITMFLMVYILLLALFIFLINHKIKHGPEEISSKPDDLVYRNIYPNKRG